MLFYSTLANFHFSSYITILHTTQIMSGENFSGLGVQFGYEV